ncbi:AbfB domain-containing protein [Streptomyces sp. NPDC001796]|uniref:AbfB domain-containing protein n=1 Tax=Streptomyces sp. NPDC001796 TaxID=3364609 RepID=UPI0036ADC389
MPDTNPPPTPDRPAPSPVWETGDVPGEARTPGSRRLWAAGLLAVAVFSTSAIAISVLGNTSGSPSPRRAQDAAVALGDPDVPDFSLPPSPVAASSGKSGLTSGKASPATKADSPSPGAAGHTAGAEPAAHASKPSAAKPPKSTPSAIRSSVRSVNYPDRYWHISGDYVKLDPIGSAPARRDATFRVVKGLAKATCYSFATADGSYLRHRNFLLRDEPDDGSSLFRQDATFCPRPSSYFGAIMLESVNYPGRFLRHQSFRLKLDPYQADDLYRADSAFRLVDGLA